MPVFAGASALGGGLLTAAGMNEARQGEGQSGGAKILGGASLMALASPRIAAQVIRASNTARRPVTGALGAAAGVGTAGMYWNAKTKKWEKKTTGE